MGEPQTLWYKSVSLCSLWTQLHSEHLSCIWLGRRLYDLFAGVSVPEQRFKGKALEDIVGCESSVLPTSPCKAHDGTKKQIDSAYDVGTHLVIVECKAVARSIAYDRGDPKAINFRQENVVERLLTEVDEKARWLAQHPIGRNFDISKYSDILPIGISPFVEFMPSKRSRYWISEDYPRVLMPGKLNKILEDPSNIKNAFNRVSIMKTK